MLLHNCFFQLLSRRQMLHLCASLLLGLLLCAVWQALIWSKIQLDTGAAVCADTLRLHIRADSDAICDQSAKLAVRDAVLAYMDEHCPAKDKAAALEWAAQNLLPLQLTARHTLAEHGSSAPVRVQLVNMYFSASHYAGAALPAGRYDAVRIDIGADDRYGKNWWCVLYPGLCRSACGGYALPQENDLVCGEYILRFKIADLWQQLTASRADILLATG